MSSHLTKTPLVADLEEVAEVVVAAEEEASAVVVEVAGHARQSAAQVAGVAAVPDRVLAVEAVEPAARI